MKQPYSGMAKISQKEMSLKNKIGQLFMVSVYQLDEAESKNQTSVTSQMKKTLKKYPAGEVIMFAKNINTPDQTKKMTDELQDVSYFHYLWQWMRKVDRFQESHQIPR